MLYQDDVIFEPTIPGRAFAFRAINVFVSFVHFFWHGVRYKYHIHYGALVTPVGPEAVRRDKRTARTGFHLGLTICRALGKKIIYVPSGCRDEALRSDFDKLTNYEVCRNCGFSDRCSDSNILPNLKRAKRYSHLAFGANFFPTSIFQATPNPYKVIDLEIWRPRSEDVTPGDRFRIIHSHALDSRKAEGRNIKATPEILAAGQRLENEFADVEFLEVTGVPPSEMRELQRTATVIVDQLRYGHWGSTAVEAMALGKVVVCYLRPDWMERFKSLNPLIDEIPIVSATPENIYDVLRALVLDPARVKRLSIASRTFAELNFDVGRNTAVLKNALIEL